MAREIKIFLRRNRVQLMIAAFCILVTVKQMEAPFICEYNAVTSILFERAPTDTTGGEILELLNNLGFAYYSSLIFYYVVDYFPTRQREKAAMEAIKDHLTQIALHIECLFTDLLFFSGSGSCIKDLKGKGYILPALCDLKLDRGARYCNQRIYHKRNDELIVASQAEQINSFDSVKKECEAIRKEVELIHNHISAEKLEDEIKDLLCVVSENDYITNVLHLNGEVFDQGIEWQKVKCTPLDFLELYGVHAILGKLPIEQHGCTMHPSTEADIKEVQEAYERLKKNNPIAVATFERVNGILQNSDET